MPGQRKQTLRAGEPWTPEEDRVLLEGIDRRVAYRHIGASIGRSPDACRDRAKLLGWVGGVRKPYAPRKRKPQAYHRGGTYVPNAPGDGAIDAPSPYQGLETCCRIHLADLLREYGEGQTLGYAKAVYRARCEVQAGREAQFIAPRSAFRYDGSSMSSPAGLCGEGM